MPHNIEGLIEKLILKTKNHMLNWTYLEDDKKVERLLEEHLDFSGMYSRSGSFSTQFNSGYFILLDCLSVAINIKDEAWTFDQNSILLIAIPSEQSKDSGVINFNLMNDTEMCQSALLRLQNIIKSNFPSVDAFIDDFMNDLPF
mgnify:CR=1 FL=1